MGEQEERFALFPIKITENEGRLLALACKHVVELHAVAYDPIDLAVLQGLYDRITKQVNTRVARRNKARGTQ